MNPAPAPVLCVAGCDWHLHNPMPEKHWMRILARGGRKVLFVNSIGVGLPAASSPRRGRRVLRKLGGMLRWLRCDGGVWILTPVILPAWGLPAVAAVNRALLALQIRPLLALRGMRRPVLWAGLPTAAQILDRVPHRSVVYYVQDNYAAYFDSVAFSRAEEDHATLLARADTVICASMGMEEQLRPRTRRTVYVPHGVHTAFFATDPGGHPVPPPELATLPRPIIGYFGSLDALLDTALVDALAAAHPEWSFVYIGTPMIDTAALARRSNVHFLGFRAIEDVPRYGAQFDAGIMPFVQSPWILYSNPIKYREYLALGLPVVAPRILELERAHDGAAFTASTHAEFIARLEEALRTDSLEEHVRRRALVEGETWEKSAERVVDVLEVR